MVLNTSKYLPFECISPNILEYPDIPEYPYLSGTGFFCNFRVPSEDITLPPQNYIFYVTAKHCLVGKDDSTITASLKIPYTDKSVDKGAKLVIFTESFTTEVDLETGESEDVVIFAVDMNVNHEDLKILIDRAILITHEEDVETIIKLLLEENGNVRTIGFSQPNDDNTTNDHTRINYEGEEQQILIKPRGFYGKITDTSNFKDRYGFEQSNWKDEYRGFSGSPVISLLGNHPLLPPMAVIGVMLTATKSRGEFISIKVVTSLISHHLYNLLVQE